MSVVTLLTASCASAAGSAPSNSAGYPMLPTPTMKPCPGIRRGTECTVPIMPGFVMDDVVPAKSSGEILPLRTFTISSSYARQNAAKSRVSASFTLGTSSECVPSRRCTSTARPRFTCWWRTTTGLPSSVAKAELRAGKSASARSTA